MLEVVQTGTVELTIYDATDTIKRTAGNFTTDGFTIGNKITLYNSSNNTATYTISQISTTSSTNDTITTSESLTAESAFVGEMLTKQVIILKLTG